MDLKKLFVKNESSKSNHAALIIFLCAVVILAIVGQIMLRPDRKTTLKLVYTGSIKGNVSYLENQNAGYEKISALVDKYVEDQDNVLLLDAGNCLGGNEIAEMDDGSSIVSIMNETGYDAMVPGLLDTTYGIDTLSSLRAEATFPFLAANLVRADGTNAFETYQIKNINNVSVGIIGVTSGVSNVQAEVDSLTVKDPVETVKEIAGQLWEKTDAIIVLLYSGDESVAESIIKITGVNLVINGGTTEASAKAPDDDKMIVAPGEKGSSIGVINIRIKRDKVSLENNFVKATQYGKIESDVDVSNLIADKILQKESLDTIQLGYLSLPVEETEETSDYYDEDENYSEEETAEQIETETVSESETETEEVPADEDIFNNNVTETITGDIVADAILNATSGDNTVAAVIPDRDIHGQLEDGIVSQGDVYSLFDDALYIVTCRMTGGDLRLFLENSFRDYPEAKGFLQVSGLSYTFNSSTALGSSISDISIGYSDLDDARTYVVAMTNDLAEDLGYTSESSGIVNTYHTAAYTVCKYIEKYTTDTKPVISTNTDSEEDSGEFDQSAIYNENEQRIYIY